MLLSETPRPHTPGKGQLAGPDGALEPKKPDLTFKLKMTSNHRGIDANRERTAKKEESGEENHLATWD